MKLKMYNKIIQYFEGKGNSCLPLDKETESVNEAVKKDEYERCIMCGAETTIPISMPIDWRENYEIGLGQLCPQCAKKTQNEATQENALSYEQIILAVEQSRKENDK